MARVKHTARKSTCRFLPPRLRESTLVASYRDAYEDWKRMQEEEALKQQQEGGSQHAQPDEEEEDPDERLYYVSSDSEEELEQQQEEEQEEEPQQEEQLETQQSAIGGDPSNDPDDDGDDGDDEDDEEDEPQAPSPPPQGIDAGRGWVVYSFVRDGGDCFFHRRLIRLLRNYYGAGQVAVEYHSWWWTHARYNNFWRTQVHVRVPNSTARAAREKSIHFAITDRETQEAGIADAARQALYAYRYKLYPVIQHKAEKWYPRRRSGQSACTIASTAGIEDAQLASTVALTAALNTELDAALEENERLREQLNRAHSRIEALEEHYMGAPAPRSPTYRGESPPRKRTYYGDAASRTTVDP